ncbi:hypothetical protein COCON_G00189980 [Conger conger]|uniref:Uncharacterized protein n=1 Tax=Conger conger TaxID=82655 RepID=A0A9Q1HQA2_CONCO|nr:hypothetical protein COCON_G00189980 [Conger conger]
MSGAGHYNPAGRTPDPVSQSHRGCVSARLASGVEFGAVTEPGPYQSLSAGVRGQSSPPSHMRPTLREMYGRYTQELGDYAKEEAARLREEGVYGDPSLRGAALWSCWSTTRAAAPSAGPGAGVRVRRAPDPRCGSFVSEAGGHYPEASVCAGEKL